MIAASKSMVFLGGISTDNNAQQTAAIAISAVSHYTRRDRMSL